MRHPISLYSAAHLTGIEPSQLQFIYGEFAEFLSAAGRAESDPGDFTLIQEIHQRIFVRRERVTAIRTDLQNRKRRLLVVAVTSGKGGVGKTTVSINLAIAFAQRGSRVLLLDADLGMPNVHVFAGIQPRATLLDFFEGGRPLAEIAAPGPGDIDVICGPSGISRMADLDPRRIELLGRDLARLADRYDVALLDTGAGISAQVMQFLGLAEAIVVVATPNLASTLDAYGVVKLMHERRLGGRVHILVNQAASAEQAGRLFSRIEGCARQFLQRAPESLGFLPHDPMFEAANQNRRPITLAAPEDNSAVRFLEMAHQLAAGAASARAEAASCTAAA